MGQRKKPDAHAANARKLYALLLLWIGLMTQLAGCGFSNWAHNGFKVGPDYYPPLAEVADNWLDDQDSQVITVPPASPEWWLTFQDPILDGLIQTAYDQNLTLNEAAWRVMQARSQRAIAAGNLLPQSQQGFGEFEHIQESKSVALPPPLRAFNQWSTGLNLTWELDVWGRYRRAIASANDNLEAVVGDYDAILLCLIADVATTYAEYRTFQRRLVFARQNVKIQEASLKLTQKKADEGSTGYTSVYLAESSLEATRAGIPNLEIGLRQSSNQLCTLLGIPVRDLTELLGSQEIPTAPAEVAVGIPADLIRRRPDIRAAERAVAAQSEQIGIALSDLYPQFVISGEFTFDSEKFGDLFKSASSGGSIGPSFQWDLLNYGRIINNVQLQESGFDELVASYRNTVLTANQEVEDTLVAFLQTQQRVRNLEKSVTATEEALKLLTISFNEGDIDFTGVFLLQGTLAQQQDQLAAARGEVATSLISLYKALGGGWEIRCPGYESSQIVYPVTADAVEVLPTPEELPLPPNLSDDESLPPAIEFLREGNSDDQQ